MDLFHLDATSTRCCVVVEYVGSFDPQRRALADVYRTTRLCVVALDVAVDQGQVGFAVQLHLNKLGQGQASIEYH